MRLGIIAILFTVFTLLFSSNEEIYATGKNIKTELNVSCKLYPYVNETAYLCIGEVILISDITMYMIVQEEGRLHELGEDKDIAAERLRKIFPTMSAKDVAKLINNAETHSLELGDFIWHV